MRSLATALLLVIFAVTLSAQTQQSPLSIGGHTKPPEVTKYVAPEYPVEVQGIKGPVILDLTIDPSGKVRDVRVTKDLPPVTKLAIAAVKQWEYAPTLDAAGKPAWIRMTVIVQFPPRASAEAASASYSLEIGGRFVTVAASKVKVAGLTLENGRTIDSFTANSMISLIDLSTRVPSPEKKRAVIARLKLSVRYAEDPEIFQTYLVREDGLIESVSNPSTCYQASPAFLQRLRDAR